MARKSYKIFNVKLSNDLFVDPLFSKKTNLFFPINYAILEDRRIELLSGEEFRLLIGLLKVAHRSREASIKVDERLWKANGKLLERSISKLSDFGYLEFSIYKEIINNSRNSIEQNDNNEDFNTKSSVPKKETLSDSLPSLPKKENYSHWFEKFVIEEVGSLDTGQTRKAAIVQRAFSGEEGFLSWANSVAATKTFKNLKTEERQRYFFKALDGELKSRGVV